MKEEKKICFSNLHWSLKVPTIIAYCVGAIYLLIIIGAILGI